MEAGAVVGLAIVELSFAVSAGIPTAFSPGGVWFLSNRVRLLRAIAGVPGGWGPEDSIGVEE